MSCTQAAMQDGKGVSSGRVGACATPETHSKGAKRYRNGARTTKDQVDWLVRSQQPRRHADASLATGSAGEERFCRSGHGRTFRFKGERSGMLNSPSSLPSSGRSPVRDILHQPLDTELIAHRRPLRNFPRTLNVPRSWTLSNRPRSRCGMESSFRPKERHAPRRAR